jgi:uncharacterized protein (DUF2249 family)
LNAVLIIREKKANTLLGEIKMEKNFTSIVNVPDFPPREKHPTIFRTFDELNSGEDMLIVNDHDPRPLLYQFMMERPEQFEWQYLEEGPEVWKVAISKK